MNGRRIIVCGGRGYRNRDSVYWQLDRIHTARGIAVVIHGAARGADSLAAEWAQDRCVLAEPYPADWASDGKAAGPIRNQRMLDQAAPDAVVAFPGGRGTDDMVRRAKVAGVPVLDHRQGVPTRTVTGNENAGTG